MYENKYTTKKNVKMFYFYVLEILFSLNVLLTVRSELEFVFLSGVCIMTEYIAQSFFIHSRELWIYI